MRGVPPTIAVSLLSALVLGPGASAHREWKELPGDEHTVDTATVPFEYAKGEEVMFFGGRAFPH